MTIVVEASVAARCGLVHSSSNQSSAGEETRRRAARLAHGGENGGYKRVKLEPQRTFLERLRAEKSDITLHGLCDRLLAERGVAADTSLTSRLLRRIGVTLKKRRSS